MKTSELIKAANDSFYSALNAMFKGEMEGMNRIWSHGDQVTQMGPFGGRLVGWQAVGSDFQKNADLKMGGSISCKDLHVFAGKDMGYTSCVEEGENKDADGKMVKVRHRATNIFHLENGEWKMVHHQTDISPQLENAFKEAITEEVQ